MFFAPRWLLLTVLVGAMTLAGYPAESLAGRPGRAVVAKRARDKGAAAKKKLAARIRPSRQRTTGHPGARNNSSPTSARARFRAALGKRAAGSESARGSVPSNKQARAGRLGRKLITRSKARAAGKPGAARKSSVAKSAARPAAKSQSRGARAVRSLRPLVRGVAIDGPRHTWSAIKRNPIAFLGGWLAIGAVGVAGSYMGFNGEIFALGISGTAVLAQVKAAWPSMKTARGAERLRIIGSEVVWPALFWTTSTLIGHNLAQHGGGGHHGSSNPVNTFVSTAIVGSDGPALGVTALDSARGRNAAPAH